MGQRNLLTKQKESQAQETNLPAQGKADGEGVVEEVSWEAGIDIYTLHMK